jgi:post-segregation antitoxin (ccd killing protein)
MGPYAAPPTSRLWARREGRIDRRMPRMQVYLPEAMYEQVKTRGLPVSELLQKAVQAELRRQDLLAETDRYLGDLVAEVGAPSAAAVARRLSRRVVRKAG